MGGEVSTDSKSSNGIEISQFVQVLSYPGGWVGGWLGVGLGRGTPHTCAHVHVHACMCTLTCMHVKHDKHGCLRGGGHLQFPNMFILVFRACASMHMHVHMCRDTPPCPQMPPTHLPPPQSPREPKSTKVYKSWTNWDNSILLEKSLPLNIPELI